LLGRYQSDQPSTCPGNSLPGNGACTIAPDLETHLFWTHSSDNLIKEDLISLSSSKQGHHFQGSQNVTFSPTSSLLLQHRFLWTMY
jgi:hypothetical protein